MRRSRIALVALVITALFSGSARAAGPTAEMPSIPEKVRLLMQDRNYPEAIAAIEEAAKVKENPQDYLAYLKGWALYLAKQYGPAVAALEQMEKQFPASPWVRRARFAKALALARKGDFRAAELIYRAEASYLLSAERSHQVADIYLEFADASFRPPKEEQKPDYAKAVEYYTKALAAGPKPERRDEVELRIAVCCQQLSHLPEAIQRYVNFSRERGRSPLDIEARFRLGECWMAQHSAKEARRVWQDLLAAYPDDRSERIAEAGFQLSRTWGIPAPGSKENLSLGVAALEAFVERFPAHKLAGEAYLNMAQSYSHQARYDDAARSLVRFLGAERYRDRKEVPEARYLLGKSYQMQHKFAEALAAWREYLAKHPTHERWSTVQQEMVTTEYLAAEDKLQAKQYDEAIRLWSDFLVKHPLDGRNPQILEKFAEIRCLQKNWEAAIAEWRRLISKYPASKEAALAQWQIAATLENRLGRLDEALEQYRKIESGPNAARAAQAVARLTSPSLAIATERVFRSDEMPRLKLTTRNLESVSVRAYKIDLETYFRKMHLVRGAEQLNIALIDPDRTFEFKVPRYAKYRQSVNEVEVPLPEGLRAGAMVVTVSSKTLETTTLILQSDLDIVVKSSRDEVFVFAENLRTGKPWPGARLLVSDGRRVLAEATTGTDGVLKRTVKELKDAEDVRVFAAADGHAASNTLDIARLSAAQGLADKGYLYTDRPAYQPGQTVGVRGCIRHVARDVYAVAKDRKYALTVLDPRDRQIWQEQVQCGPFGSFHARFRLPPNCPQGAYRLVARDVDGRSYQGAFEVQQYKLEPVRLTVDAPRRVYYRGDVIEGTIRAASEDGAPLAQREIRYQLANDRVYTARTDKQGQVRFQLPTREFGESQTLPLVVTLSERNLQTKVNFYLAQQGFTIELSARRSVFLAGETFEVTAKVRDAEGKPLAQKLRLQVIEQTSVEGEAGQRTVQEHPLETAADGLARQVLKIEKGGPYLVRVEGVDRFHSAIFVELKLLVSDADDRQRLRILADQYTYRVGDTGRVRVVWREEPALALVTYQGAVVLGYELVPLRRGENVLSVPMTAALAPNFELSVDVMTDGRPAVVAQPESAKPANKPTTDERPIVRFHHVSSPFAVQRDLRVTIAAARKDGQPGPIRPGAEAAVTLVATDPQGKPVAAELSLALVERSLLERFAWRMPAIQAFFHEQRREVAVRTESSITFACHPATRPIDSRLLADRQRQQIAAEEEASRGMGGMAQDPAAMPAPSAPTQGGRRSSPPPQFGGFDPFADTEKKEKKSKPTWDFDQDQDAPSPSAKSERKDERLAAATAIDYGATKATSRLVTPSLPIEETGYWNPAIVTGKDGRATVAFTMPDRSTAWTLLVKGLTVDTLAGEASQELVVKKELFGEMKLPAAFTDGDEAEIGVVIHNHAIDKGPIEVRLRTTIAGRAVEEKKTVEVQSRGLHELDFKTRITRAAAAPAPGGVPSTDAVFELTVIAGNRQDVVRRAVSLMPYGMQVFAAASGAATSDTTVWVEAPKQMPVAGPALQIHIGPTVERSLLDVVLTPAAGCPWEAGPIASPVETATSDLMASLALQKLMAASRDAGSPQSQALDERIRSTLGLLVSSQDKQGAWSWTGEDGSGHCYSTARAVWAVSLARAAGYAVPDETLQKALAWLRSQFTAVGNSDYESKAIVLHALAAAGNGDFALANGVYRQRTAMSTAALLYLALTFVEMDRASTAGELLALVAKRNLDLPAERDPFDRHALTWSHSPVEIRALYALAVQRAAVPSKAKELVDWLLAHRTGTRWAPDKATGPATLALAEWFAKSRFEGDRYRLAVVVNDVQVKVLEVDPAAGTQTVNVPPNLLKAGKQRINFQITGRGRYVYQCVLGGFVPADKVASTTKQWRVERFYQPARLEIDGREIPRGFGIVEGPHTRFRNVMTQLALGARGVVELVVERVGVSEITPQEQLEYLVITEPIPSGGSVIEGSVRGGFDRFEILPGAIVFYVGNRRSIEPIHYELRGYLPGAYRAAPTVIRNAYRPEQLAVARPRTLTVLGRGATSADKYRPTPQELFELGKLFKAKGRSKEAQEHFTELVEKWNLEPAVYRQAIQSLLELHLELGPPGKVVRYFEIVKEKWPEQEIPFAQILKAGAAYHEMGEYERSYLIFRATVESGFLREAAVAGFLDAQGEFSRSVQVMARLLSEYPPEAYLAAAWFGLSQRVCDKAPEAAADPKLRQEKVNRVDLLHRAWHMLENLLTEFTADPAADQAAFSAASVLLDLRDYAQAAAACDRYARRYPKSELLDTYWYILGYCRFLAGQSKEAIQMCRQVAETQLPDPQTGRPKESANKWRAIFILGQIYHSLGEPAQAIREYRRVEDRFHDARRSIDYFLRKSMEVPEVTRVKPGQAAEVELKFRNLAACDVKVYRVDLVKFALFERGLGGIARINLAGIRPQFETAVPLGDGRDYRDRSQKLPLPIKKEGAYLVVCRGENLHASGLVLVTPLAVEVQVEAESGQVRTTLKDDVTGRYVGNAQIRVIGTGNEDFVAGATDPRGVFVAEGIQGSPTVIAEWAPSRYAFFRTQTTQPSEDALPGGDPMASMPVRPPRVRKPQSPETPQPAATVGPPIASSQPPVAAGTPGAQAAGPGMAPQPVGPHGLPTSLDIGGPSAALDRILAALASPTTLEFVETPLGDVVAFLKDLHKIEIQLDAKALSDVGVSPDTPITRNLKGATLRSALRLILGELDLTYVIDHEVLLITTPEKADAKLATKVYPVADLIGVRDESGQESCDFDSLIDLITSTVRPTAWDAVGGPGSIAPMDSTASVVLSQTQEVHEEVEKLLETLRKVKAAQGASPLPSRSPQKDAQPMGGAGGMGGMGGGKAVGMGGGMGGSMGGGMGMFGGSPPAAAAKGKTQDESNDLLQGVQATKKASQGKQVEKLNKMYKSGQGMGGVGAGAAY